MTIPNEINSLIIEPLINLYSPKWEIMKKNLEKFKDEKILKNSNKYIDLLAKNIEWFLNLEKKYKLEEYLYTNYPDQYKIYFREYHRIISLIAKEALNSNYFHDPNMIYSVYDVFLESDDRRGYYYAIKFYHSDESILDVMDKVERLISKNLRVTPRKISPGYQNGFPKWKNYEYSFSEKDKWYLNLYFDFIENDPKIPHNNIYLNTIFIENKIRKNFWKHGPPGLVESLKKIIEEISQFVTLDLINHYNLPDEIHKGLLNKLVKILVPDTNLLLHGKFITEISWESILENQEITILIPYVVLNEIDKAKYSNNTKRKKRARKLISFFKKYDNNEDYQNRFPLIISPKKINWNNLQSKYREILDENEPDHHILAELLFKYPANLDDVYLITGDYTFLKLALEFGIMGIDWMEDEKYKEVFTAEDKKENKPRLPDLGVYFDDHMTKEYKLQEISEKPELLSIDDLIEDNFEYQYEDDLKYEVKEEIEELIDIYNKQLEQINNHQEINLILRNDCNHPYNDIEIYITTILENDFILTIGELIKRPVKPKIPEYDGDDSLEKIRKDLQTGIYLLDTEKLVRMHNLKLNMRITSEKKVKHTKWEVIYLIDRIKHNTIIDLHPLLIFLPDSYKTDKIELKNCASCLNNTIPR